MRAPATSPSSLSILRGAAMQASDAASVPSGSVRKQAPERSAAYALYCAQFGRMIFSVMRIIARRTLREFVAGRASSKDRSALKAALDAWFDEVKKARWRNTADVKRRYATASIVSADRMVFNIKGNDCRLVVAVDFEKTIVW